MLTSFKTLQAVAFCSLLALAACGGPAPDDAAADDLATQASGGPYEPFAHFAAVKKLAAKYGKSPAAVSLHGAMSGDAMQANSGAYAWTWTLMGQDGIWVDVSAGPKGNKVLAHEKRYCFVAPATFDPKDVPVDGNDVVQLVLQAGLAQPTELDLGGGVAGQGAVRWSALLGGKQVLVDATNGAVTRN